MRIVTIARKAFEGSATQNCAEHGCGALNIDGCRLSSGGSHMRPPVTKQTTVSGDNRTGKALGMNAAGASFTPTNHPGGRWPANLILQHQPGCRQTGTTTAPGYVINRWDDGAKPFGGGAGHEYTGEKQGDETVAVWECVEGCSVEGLGEQSGVQRARGNRTPTKRNQSDGVTSWGVGQPGPIDGGDAGTAARYFKQVQERDMDEELIEYLTTLISPPVEYEPVVLVQNDLAEYPWGDHEDQSVHGLITSGNPEPYMKEIDRVLKPGAHVLMISDDTDLTGAEAACAIEDFGYEIRDAISVLDTPGEFHYVAKSGKKERNAGVPVFKAEVTFERYFPLEGVDQDDLWEQINEVVAEKYLDNWLLEGIPEEELPDHLLSLFEERVLVDVTEFRNNHATVKPIAIMEALMEDLPQGSLIVDPFMGSGTTGIAALKHKMGFIGIEQDANYLKIAHHRIHHADRANAAWLAADIESEAEEEEKESKSLMDFFGI